MMNASDTHRTMSCYKQPYANKLEGLRAMDRFMDIHNLLKLNHEAMKKFSRPISRMKTESVTKFLIAKS